MKKLLLSSAALLGLTAGAMAADLPSRRVAPAPYVAVPVFTWTGFYVGVNAGYGFSNNDRNDNYPYYTGVVAPYYGYDNDRSRDGFVGGGQIGYNYQVGQFVIGVEADIQYADLNGRRNDGYLYGTAFPASYAYGYGNNRGIDWFGTVRARAGVAFDRALLYVTGGFAYGGGDSNNNNYYYASTYPYGYNNDDDIRGGWVVGGGLEYAFTPNWTAKIEGLYVSLDRSRNNNYYYGAPVVTTVGYPYYNNRHNNDEFGVVRVGLNYKF
jgi:outer membrane immunogenic protein